MRVIRIGAAIVGALILLVLLFAVVNEYVLAPNRAVADVNGTEITLQDWQDRVVYERSQRIIALEEQLELFNNDVGIIQQFAGQSLTELLSQSAETFGQAVLEATIDDELVRQAAAERGIEVSEAELEARTGEYFNYYGGESPTAVPTGTATVVPTPSVTPIGAEAVEEADSAEVDATPAPTNTPFPTPTPVSEESFQEEYNTLIDNLTDMGAKESVYKDVIVSQILREQLIEALVEEQNLSEEAPHASFYALVYTSEEEAEAGLEEILDSDYLTVWNTVRSAPPAEAPEEGEEAVVPPTATEILWRTQDSVESSFGTEVAEVVFSQPVDVPGAVLEVPNGDGTSSYVILMVSGREDRPLSSSELTVLKQELLTNYLAEQRINGDVTTTEYWRGRVPMVPALDQKFLAPPTEAPTQPPTAEVETEPDSAE